MLEKLASMLKGGQSRHKTAAHIAAIYLHSEHLKLVQLQTTPLQVQKVETLVPGPDTPLMTALLQLCAELPAHTELCLVLCSERYQLVQLDKPAVKADEMLQALPWLVRELTSLPVDDMLLDYLDLPEHTSAQGARINVVVTSKSSLLELCRALQRKNIQLANIQPEEWLPRNLIPLQSAAVMLLVHQPGQELSLQIIKQGMVYFSRKLRGFNRIDQYEMAELRQGMLDNLLLEVQRSLDYFEGQLRQAPVKEILFQIASPELPAIVRYFTENGFVQVRQLELSPLMQKLSLAEQQDYWLTMAGAVELLKARSSSMKLRVNLYQAALQPRHDKMTLNQLGRAAALVSALLLLGAVLAYQQLADVRAQQQLLQQQQQQKLQELEIYQQTLASRQPSMLLQQQAAVLEQSISQKQQLLSYLQQETSKTPPRYADVMRHLEAIDPKGLWLTGFSLGTIQRFDGVASSGVLLPEWLKALGTTATLQGLHFSTIKVEPLNEGQYRQFSVLASPPALPAVASASATPAAATAVPAETILNNGNGSGGQP